MTQVVPVNLAYNVKTLWFDPNGIELHAADDVVVSTARGLELGSVAGEPFDVPYEDVKALKSPLKPVLRQATPEDLERAKEMERLAEEAMPVFREMARETSEDMHPVSVEYLLDGDKAVFYFEAEERVDFRDLVKRLATHFKVRIDMRQIGVRDEARIVGGIAHCGQEVCCKRLGGEFKPVSIRMAKDQDLSLNPQKISGLCGRLMCCLRYENEAYKDFKKRAPKVGSTVSTPEGPASVCSLDVPREDVVVRIDDNSMVKVPIEAFEPVAEGKRPTVVSDEGWAEATAPKDFMLETTSDIFSTAHLTGSQQLAKKGVQHSGHGAADPLAQAGSGSGSRSKGSGSNKGNKSSSEGKKRGTRRRSTKLVEGKTEQVVSSDGQQQDKRRSKNQKPSKKNVGKQTTNSAVRPGQKSSGLSQATSSHDMSASSTPERKRHRRRRSISVNKDTSQSAGSE